jgi:hypothetical protein
MFDPEKVERYVDEKRYSTLTPVGDYRGGDSYIRASVYDQLLELYRALQPMREVRQSPMPWGYAETLEAARHDPKTP